MLLEFNDREPTHEVLATRKNVREMHHPKIFPRDLELAIRNVIVMRELHGDLDSGTLPAHNIHTIRQAILWVAHLSPEALLKVTQGLRRFRTWEEDRP